MNRKLPEELSINVDGKHATLTLHIPQDLFWFKGHFMSQPLLPGVAQLNWVIYYCEKAFNIQVKVKSIEVIKFQIPILPNGHLILDIALDDTLNKLQFTYTIADKVASSGKVTLCK